MKLKISLDGDMFCVLLGENLQEGIVGFGPTLSDAFNDFEIEYENHKKKEAIKLYSKK